MAKLNKVIGQVIQILKKDNRGLTIQELSEQTQVSRITMMVALAKLEGSGDINVRVVGNCKLNYLRKGNREV